MRILHISTSDKAGGAEKVAYDLFHGARTLGHESYLAVGTKTIDDSSIIEIPNDQYRNMWTKPWRKIQRSFERKPVKNEYDTRIARIAGWIGNLFELPRWVNWQKGHEDFYYPGTTHLPSLVMKHLDIMHLHNLHGGYFDLRKLPYLSSRLPIFITLHDEWSFTGHCACTFGCDNWKSGCGNCPRLDTYPAIKRDATHYNWKLKQDIYRNSKLYVSAPSAWLLNKANDSIIKHSIVEQKLIPYGIDLNIYKPGDKNIARKELNLPLKARIILFVANATRSNKYKDYQTIESAINKIANNKQGDDILFVCVGEASEDKKIGALTIKYFGYQRDPRVLAKFYQASDIYLHAAKTESFGLVISEAMACNLPVVATSVGGIPEVVEDCVAGYLVPAGDGEAMCDRATHLLNNERLRFAMGDAASELARNKFSIDRYISNYLTWYEKVLNKI